MTHDRDPNPLDALRRSVADDHELDDVVAGRIESRLRVLHAEAAPSPRPRWRPALVAPALAVIVLALSIGFVLRSSEPVAALVVTDAENVTVRLPDGSVVDPSDGFELPDGAVVEIGTGGMVTVDDIVLDGAGVLAVRDGRLVADVVATTTTPRRPDHLEPEPSVTVAPQEVTTTTSAPPVTTTPALPPTTTTPALPTTTPEPSTTPESDTPTTTEPNDRDDRPDDQRDGDDRTSDRGDRRDDDGEPSDPAPTDERDGDATPPSDEPDPTDRDGGGDDPVDAPLTVTIALDLELVVGGVSVAWNVDGLQPGWSVVIARAIGDRAPSVIVTSPDATGQIVDEPTRDDGQPADRRVRYRLVVLDEAGGQVASGPRQSLR